MNSRRRTADVKTKPTERRRNGVTTLAAGDQRAVRRIAEIRTANTDITKSAASLRRTWFYCYQYWRLLTLRRLRRDVVAATPVGHELVELGLVLGFAQTPQEVLELALLVFEPAQRLSAIFVERAVA